MYAVIQTGGKQYRVAVGDKLNIEKLAVSVGDAIALDRVLMVADGDALSVGTPLLANASVGATVIGEGRGDKVRIFKMKRRKGYRRTQGHRQSYTQVRIDTIQA
ncbi:MAG: 50S ribosomal protein L21 [Proteobacteria bacterium]|nr:50S ribosomal protein L21 [Burkholderiales bacterium]